MSNGNHIEDELSGMDSKLPGGNPYSVPEGYFEGLAANILSRVKGVEESAGAEIASLSPLLASISRTMPYGVPSGYFEEPADLSYVMHEPVLPAGLTRQLPYTVPQGYFEELPALMLRKLAPAKVVPMFRRKWAKMAVAAALTGIMAISGYFFLNGKDEATDTAGPIAQQLKNVSNKELDEFIRTTEITPVSNQTVTTKKSQPDKEIRELLNGVSDSEMEDFLNQVPTDDEDLLVIN